MAHPSDTTRPGRLTSRPEFLAVQKGLRLRGPLFLLEMIDRKQPGALPRIGYTVTRKQGNAVERNRMRRRLREAIRLAEGVSFLPGHDYVLVARRDVLDAPFTRIGTALAERVAEGHRKLARAEAPGGARAADLPNQPRRVTNPQAPGNK